MTEQVENSGPKPLPLPSWVVPAAYAALVALLLVPLFLVDHPQATDLPNHLARQYIRFNLPQSDVLGRLWTFRWVIFPYQAMDVFVAALQPFFGIYLCGKILIGAIIIIWTLAPAVLHRVLWRRWSLWPLLAGLVVYNANIAWGFAAYSLVAGLAVLALAGWIATDNGRHPFIRMTLFSVISFLLYCGHLTAFAIFGLLVGGYELAHLRENFTFRRFLVKGLYLAPMFAPGILHFGYTMLQTPPVHRVETLPLTLADRLSALLSPFVDGLETVNNMTINITSLSSLYLLVAVFGLMTARKSVILHPSMKIALGLIAVVALLTPAKLLGISFTHFRLPFMVFALLCAAARIEEEDRYICAFVALAFGAIMISRVGDIADNWRSYDAQAKEMVSAAAMVRPGDKLLVVSRNELAYVEHYHTASLLVIEKQAFIPNLFAITPGFSATPEYKRLAPPTATHPIDADLLQVALDHDNPRLDEPAASYWKTWWKDYDYVLAYQPPGAVPLYPQQLEPVAEGSYFALYKVKAEK